VLFCRSRLKTFLMFGSTRTNMSKLFGLQWPNITVMFSIPWPSRCVKFMGFYDMLYDYLLQTWVVYDHLEFDLLLLDALDMHLPPIFQNRGGWRKYWYRGRSVWRVDGPFPSGLYGISILRSLKMHITADIWHQKVIFFVY